MKAIVIDEGQPNRALVLREVPDPAVGRNDLLVAVRAAALNRADLRRAASHLRHQKKIPSQPLPASSLQAK